MDKWVDHILISVKNYTYLETGLVVLLRFYELEIGIVKKKKKEGELVLSQTP